MYRLAIPCVAALLLLAGCGSSKSSSSASTESQGSVSTGSETSASSSGASSSSQSEAKKGKPRSGLEFTRGKTPNWATPAANAPVQSGVVPIAYRYIAIAPDAIKVKVGSTLKWTNFDSVPHNVTSEGASPVKLASGNFGEGKSFAIKVTKPGVIHYESTNYPTTMNGTIVVVE